MYKVYEYDFVNKFECLKDACPDTCCKNWDVQLNPKICSKYKEMPSLQNIGIFDIDSPRLVRDEKGYCTKFKDGLCQVHTEFGEEYLSDACNFYPKVVKKIGENILVSATASCPAIARNVLLEGDFNITERNYTRLPEILKNYNNLSLEEIKVAQEKIFNLIDEAENYSAALLRIYEQFVPNKGFSKNELPILKLLLVFALMVKIGKANNYDKLLDKINKLERDYNVKLDIENLSISELNFDKRNWPEFRPEFDQIIKNYIKLQIAMYVLPHGTNFNEISKKIELIAIKVLIINLFKIETRDELVELIQILSRVLDHQDSYDLVFTLCLELQLDLEEVLMEQSRVTVGA